jgi:MFS family permease
VVTTGRITLRRDRDFVRLFAATTSSEFGTQISQLALPLVAVITLRASPFEVGLLFALQMVGSVIFGLPAGVWVDRLRRRNIMIASDAARAVLFATVPIAWWQDSLTMAHLLALACVAGIFTTFFDVACQSYLPHLVGRRGLTDANSHLEAMRNISAVGGPTAAGGIVALLGAPLAVGGDALSFVISAVFISRIRKREKISTPQAGSSLVRDVRAGIRFVFDDRSLRAILLSSSIYNFFASIVSALLIVLLARTLALSVSAIGLIFSCTAVGALFGAVSTRRIVEHVGYGPTMWLSLAVAVPFGLLLPVASRGALLWFAVAGYTVVWFGTTVYNITQVTYRQGLTPDGMLGRMNASMRFFVGGTLPLGSLVGGVLAEVFSVRTGMWIGSVGLVTAFVPVLLSPIRSARELPTYAASEPADLAETSSINISGVNADDD